MITWLKKRWSIWNHYKDFRVIYDSGHESTRVSFDEAEALALLYHGKVIYDTPNSGLLRCNVAHTCTLIGHCHHQYPHAHDKRCDYGYCGMADKPMKCEVAED